MRWYLRTFRLSTAPGTWHYQNRYVRGAKNDWPIVKKKAVDEAAVLRHLDPGDEYWIASRAATMLGVSTTSFIVLDFDADKHRTFDEGRAVAWERVKRVVAYIGTEYSPLMFLSPSGGYHVYYFLDRPTSLAELVDLRRPKKEGLVPDVVRAATGEFGSGVCEMFPLRGNVVRWPMGSSQHWVDPSTGDPVLGMGLDAMRTCVETHLRAVPRLPVAHLRSKRPVVNRAVRRKKAALDAGVTEADLTAAAAHAVTLHPATVAKATRWFEHGLSSAGTRNEAMFTIALAMHHAKSALAPLGFDATVDLPDQLFAWLSAKHNGMSKEYTGSEAAEMWWRTECRRVIASAADVKLATDFQEGLTMLREAEWERAVEVAQQEGRNKRERFRLFVVAACVLRKGKWSFYATDRDFAPLESGLFPGEIHHKWIRQIPFCKELGSFQRYRKKLLHAGYMTLEVKADRNNRRATVYGFRFFTDSPRFDFDYSPADLRDALSRIEGADRLDKASFDVALYLSRRFTETELVATFGKGAVKFMTERLALIRAAIRADDGVLTKAA